MSLENEAQGSLDKAMDSSPRVDKESKITYTREFLLSLSELECCKELPRGFDQFLLSEFEDSSHGIHDRLKTHSSIPLQAFRRTEYGSSPPTKGDSGNYSRSIYGRWDSRSSGRSEWDSDSQPDRESDSGRRYGNQSRKSWQGTEHDGLLGSGSFPRPSGYSAGISAPKVRSNDQYQLNRSNEPYHPPRPYKAAALSRRDTDLYNDETFGSTECTNEDRVEEERRRRASFELMRKEQQKALQEKLKSNLEKHNADSTPNVSLMLDDIKEEKVVLNRNEELDSTSNPCSNDTGKSALHSQAPCRPLVPPGFKNTVVEKASGLKSLTQQSHLAENGIHGSLERKSSGEISLNDQPPEDKSTHILPPNKDEQSANSSLCSDVSSKKIGVEDFLHQTSTPPEAHETLNEPEFVKLDAKVSGLELGGELNESEATSILDKIFSNATTMNVSISDSTENRENGPDGSWSEKTVPSSKFARWFVEEERKTEDERSSRPNDLLSLIVGGDKGRNQVDTKPWQHFLPEFPDQGPEIANISLPNASSAPNGVSEPLPNGNNQEVIPAILTCEDLEQTFLSEYSEKGPNSRPPLESWGVSGAKSERPRAHVDNNASQHLLSLLQKGTSLVDTIPKITSDIDPSKIPPASHGFEARAVTYNTGPEVSKNIHTAGESLTLETLFGTAFMKELKSVEAPVSVQRGSVGSSQAETLEPQGLSFSVTDNGLFPSTIDQLELEKVTNEKNFLASNLLQQVKTDKTEKWLGYDDPQIQLNLSNNQAEVVSKHGGYDGLVEYHLPEEESLIAVNEDLNSQISRLIPGRNLSKKESSASTVPIDMADKLAAMGSAIKDERSMTGPDVLPFLHGPYNQMERDMAYRDLHTQTSTSHFHSLQMGHGRQLLHPLDSHPAHVNSQMKFVGRESIIQHEAPANQQFPGNMLRPPFSQPNVGLSGFDLPAHHQMLQQMQMAGSFSPHLVNDFPRGAPAQLGNQSSAFMQEINPAQGYPFGSRHTNMSSIGTPLPASNIHSGSNHPEPFQRLVESKQIPPFAVGHSQAMYGNELDMGFRYR